MIGMLLAMVLLVASSWALVALARRLSQQRRGSTYWVAFGMLLVSGVGLGFWCAFYFEYYAGPNFRISSFPLPTVFFHLEDGHWVDFPVSQLQAWASCVANIISIAALATSPLWLLCLRPQQ